MVWIGIDTGTHTGFAVWDDRARRFLELSTLPIHRAMEKVLRYAASGSPCIVVFEDARRRTWFGDDWRKSRQKLQGAGSVKRDCSIWEAFLKDKGIRFSAVPPVKGGTKLPADRFRALTGYAGRTSNHARDAAILVFGR